MHRQQLLILFITGFLIGLGFNSFAQILNSERYSSSDTILEKKLDFLMGGSFSFDKQSQNLADINLNSEFSRYINRNRLVLIGLFNTDLTYNGRSVIQNTGFLHFRLRDNNTCQLYPELFTQFQWNGSLGLISRFLYGCNLRGLIIQNKKTILSAGYGIFEERENWVYSRLTLINGITKTENVKVLYDRLKSNHYLKLVYNIDSKINLSISCFYQSRFTSYNLGRISSDIKLSYNVGSRVMLSSGFNCIYDFKPVAPIDHFYYGVKQSISFVF